MRDQCFVAFFLSFVLISNTLALERPQLDTKKRFLFNSKPGQVVGPSELNDYAQRKGKEIVHISPKQAKKALTDATRGPAASSCGVLGTFGGGNSSGYMPYSGSGEGALIILAVIGTIIIVSWYVYSLAYFVQFLFSECPGKVFVGISGLYGHGNWSSGGREAHFRGITANMGVGHKNLGFGLVGEYGEHDITDKLDSETIETSYDGYYVMGGPRVYYHWDSSNSYTYLDLIGGTSNRPDIGAMSVLRLGLSLGLGDSFGDSGPKLNLAGGGMFLNLKERQGILNEGTDIGGYWTLGLGYQF